VPLRVIVAEDNYLLRESVRRLLEEADLEVLAACEDFDSLLAAVEADPPDVVLTDIRMPPTGTDEGIRAADTLRESHPDVGVVVLSQYAEPAYALALFEQGSERRAYLLKERVTDLEQLVSAIQEVADGGSVIDPKIVDELVQARMSRPESPVARLTPRETETLGEMAQGKNNAAIAKSMVLSERAVEKHINSIFSKLDLSESRDVHRRVKAVLMFLSEQGG
jgi:DNA-binding NarL/FixJ family response regulator